MLESQQSLLLLLYSWSQILKKKKLQKSEEFEPMNRFQLLVISQAYNKHDSIKKMQNERWT